MANRINMDIEYFQVPNEIFDLDIEIDTDQRKKVKGNKEIVPVKRPLKTYEKLIYIYLCRRANQGSQAFPSYNDIAKKCAIGRVTAIEGVTNLIKNGLLEKMPRKTKTKQGLIKDTSNEYFINKPKKELSSMPGVPTQYAEHTNPVRQAYPSSTPGVLYKELLKKNNTKKNNINYTHDFLEWYSLYPNAFNKEQSFKNFKKLLMQGEIYENILLATKNYITYLSHRGIVDKQYITRSTNFIGQQQTYKGYLNIELEDKPEKNNAVKTIEEWGKAK